MPPRVRRPHSRRHVPGSTRSGSSRQSRHERLHGRHGKGGRSEAFRDCRPARAGQRPWGQGGAAMKSARLGLAAVGALLALVLPTVAQANEVTKWNEIAVNTVLLQPPIASQPPAAAVFMATVQGAVYGAANAVD